MSKEFDGKPENTVPGVGFALGTALGIADPSSLLETKEEEDGGGTDLPRAPQAKPLISEKRSGCFGGAAAPDTGAC